jgi:numb-like protein
MGAEHSRRAHSRRRRPPDGTTPTTTIVPDDPSKSLPSPPNTEGVRRKKHRQMDRLRRTLSFRSKKKGGPAANSANASSTSTSTNTKNNHSTTIADNKPQQWQDDEKSVRMGACSFNVKYLGSVEVQESRGMHVCEQAIQALLNQKTKHIKAILHISGDALRVVDETNKGLIVDQTIEKVSFCAPDRHHEKGFAYICRDGTTRRWLCHGFLAVKDTGERLSHAVGCAFQICLERKQKRDRECGVTVEFTQDGTSFTRFGSFRATSITERIIDPQSAIIAEPIPNSPVTLSNTTITNSAFQRHGGIERPRPKGKESETFMRSASLRLGDLNQASLGAFKRQSSLRPGDLPSIQEARIKEPLANTILEEVEPNELSKLSLIDTTNTNGHVQPAQHFSLPTTTTNTKSSFVPPSSFPTPPTTNPTQNIYTNENIASNFWTTTNQSPVIYDQQEQTQLHNTNSIADAFDSNLSALVQSNHPTNPFSPYGYSMAAQAQSPNTTHRQPAIFTPKRGTNPFDDDLIRR